MKESIIFLHGIVGNKSVFKAVVEQLKSQYNCIAYDFYDPESLGADSPFSLELLIDQLYAQYKKHGLREAHLCTLSFGCIPAMAFAKKYPYMVTSLTFIGGYCCNVPSKMHASRIQLLEERAHFEYKVWLQRYASSLNPNKKQIPENSESIFVNSALQLHPNVFEKATKIPLEFDSRTVLRGIKTPILWVMGEYDELYKETLSNLKQDIPHVEYKELKNAGHVAHIHQPEQFMSIFQPFLERTRVLLHV
ncbi:MAG TPA: alpha/beta hydrolase [Bacillus sp. (in: firmicutes)]|nr:alpha/beta hydrolase [Bacillus sp. (in: firmicutes)]